MCAHVGVMFDWEGNKQQLLQGHVSFTLVFNIRTPLSRLRTYIVPFPLTPEDKKSAFTPEDFHKI